MTNFTEFEFKIADGRWIKTCVDTKKVDTVMDKLACVTEVRLLQS